MTRILLIGYRGAGKSSVGRELARRLGVEFADTDELIIRAAGREISEIFADEGEPQFRRRESEALVAALASSAGVISLGGGAVLAGSNRDRIRAAGTCIWLKADAEQLHARIAADPGSPDRRPALTPLPGGEEIRRLLTEREPLYAETAHHCIDTAGRTVPQVVEALLDLLRE